MLPISTVIERVRAKMGRPSETLLGDQEILLRFWETAEFFKEQLKLTYESWIVGKWDMPVPANTDQVIITPSDWGEAFRIHTIDPNDPNHIPRVIDIIKQDQDQSFYSGPNTSQGAYRSPWVAAYFAPYNLGGQWYFKVLPKHEVACQYRVFYTPGGKPAPPMFDDTVDFPISQQEWLLVNYCALGLFPFLADTDKGLNARTVEFRAVCQADVAAWMPIFDARKFEMRREPAMRRKIFGTRRSGSLPGNSGSSSY